MRHKVTAIKDLKSVLHDIVPFIKDPTYLYTGRERSNFHQRPREILANWLICSVGNSQADPDAWTFSEDPADGDGVLIDRSTGKGWPTEHVFIPVPRQSQVESVESLIVKAVEHKHSKGEAYATGKQLVIFVDGVEKQWWPNRARQRIEGQHFFDSVWAVGLQQVEQNEYTYWVVCFDEFPCPCCLVSIDVENVNWSVEQIQ